MITYCTRCKSHNFCVRIAQCLSCGYEEERVKVIKVEKFEPEEVQGVLAL